MKTIHLDLPLDFEPEPSEEDIDSVIEFISATLDDVNLFDFCGSVEVGKITPVVKKRVCPKDKAPR